MDDPTRDSYALKMYNQRKATVEITPSDPQFVCQYVGKTQVYVASGIGCTQNAVQRIWDNCYDERGMRRVSVLISSLGIWIKDVDGLNKGREMRVDIKDIAYCCAEKGAHERVFSWISKDPATAKLECHALLCAAKERAQLMSLTLHRSFHIAYKDWKVQKRSAKNVAASKPATNGSSRRQVNSVTSQDSGSVSSDESSSEVVNELMETIMAQMNIVEEEEISLTDASLVIETK